MANANRKYKDSVFSLYFSDNGRLIELINAIDGTNYPEDTKVEINTLEQALYKNRKNDISFIINGEFVILIEHQSSLNENMPIRIFIYIARVYEQIVRLNNIYSTKLIKIPTPRFIVLYNGEASCDNHKVLRLSDAFITKDKNPALELKVDLYNINYGKSDVIQKSRSLEEYSIFIHYVRHELNENKKPLDEAIATAIARAIKEGIMKEFLQKYGSEVQNMLFEEWNWEQYAAAQRAEGLEEGIEKGALGMLTQVIQTMSKSANPEQIAKTLELPLSQVQSILSPATN